MDEKIYLSLSFNSVTKKQKSKIIKMADKLGVSFSAHVDKAIVDEEIDANPE